MAELTNNTEFTVAKNAQRATRSTVSSSTPPNKSGDLDICELEHTSVATIHVHSLERLTSTMQHC